MIKKATLLHLRIPFSFFLLPVFLFGVSLTPNMELWRFGLVFFILHFLLYPASNGYNSYFDKDEQSIGGLKHPPRVSKELYWVSLLMDGLALMLGFFISSWFVLFLFVYGVISKAYSHPSIRLKKYTYLGWLAAGVFQGYFTVLMTVVGLERIELIGHWQVQLAGILSTLLLFGSYPMTQVYQHEEDSKRGDITISIKLGILGTFHFTGIFFGFSTTLFFSYFYYLYADITVGLLFIGALSPVLLYFGRWYFQVRSDLANADFERTMRLNLISSLCLNLFFGWLIIF